MKLSFALKLKLQETQQFVTLGFEAYSSGK